MKNIEFKTWLGKGDWTAKSIAHRMSVVRSLERLQADFEDGYTSLELAFTEDKFASLLNYLTELKQDAKSGGQKYRALMPKSEKPQGRLSNAITFLTQYGRFLDGDEPPKVSEDWPELIELKRLFLTRCGDFQDFTQTSGTYWDLEREYKDSMIHKVREIAHSERPDVSAGEGILDLLTLGKGLNLKGGLPLGWQALDKVKKSGQAQRNAYFEIIGQLARSEAPLIQAITTAGQALSQLKVDGLSPLTKGVILSNILCTIGCIRPDEACFAKSKILNKFGNFLIGTDLLKGRNFNVDEVETFLELIARIYLIMEEDWDWKPRDYFDVQSFAWAALDERWGMNEDGLTRGAVLKAMAECDELGEAEFLSSYGFIARMRYRVVNNDADYPLKAIANVAYKFTSHGKVKNVNGGITKGSAGALLDSLKFKVIDTQENEDKAMIKQYPLNQILYGPPGTGKTWISSELAVEICDGHVPEERSELMDRYRELVAAGRIAFTTFHQSMGYEEFVEGLRPTTDNNDEDSGSTGGFRLEPRKGIFRKICALAKKSSVKSTASTAFISSVDKNSITSNTPEANNFVLIIDEINRANISKVFGELITLLEPDKRIGAGANSLQVTLPYSGDKFGVPQNLYIVGTMNTADRSIALLDTALRRRFSFIEMMPLYDIDPLDKDIEGVHLGKFLKGINGRIEWMFDRDHQIGHSFLTGVETLDDLELVVRQKIMPLLTEYFYEDWEKVSIALNDKNNNFVVREKLPAPTMESADQEERYRYLVNTEAFPVESYLAASQS